MPRQIDKRWSTMDEVAQLAGVAKITVSRVLRSPDLVSKKTKQKVNHAIESLGYVPEAAAGALSSGRSKIVGANISTLSGSIFLSTINRLSKTRSDNDIQLILSNSEYSENIEHKQLSALIAQRPLGLVISNTIKNLKLRSMLSKIKCTVIEIWDLPKNPIDCSVGFSNYEAAYSMTNFLYKMKYKKVAFLGSAESQSHRSDMRLHGYNDFQIDNAKEPRLHKIQKSIKGNIYDGAEGLKIILEKWADTDAIFCSGDVLAIGAICEARRRGLNIPKDIAICGFGDIEFGNKFGIGLTTVKVRGEEIGEQAANLIVQRSKNINLKKKIINVGFDIVKRETA